MMRNKIQGAFFLMAVFALVAAPLANADDRDDVEAVINQYIDSEGFDLTEQTKLMAGDRTYISAGMIYSNNEKSMALQTAGNKVITTANPDVQRIATIEDLKIRLNGNAAVASFYRTINDTNSVENVRAGQNAMITIYQTATMVLFKVNDEWKIVHTHLSPTK
ncbi:uncharacterized protein METZ01_LOCUS215236 [marine metagenome]|uniref:SnoaL-like domain-containing protein n=1 Tax=marine metagenome TaxID=408172 RepID=A0A382FIF0_9ZZZZ|tara:strand:- start:230 stop:718 length:489 start_codon:yes stop_codon:yes gene_type:complete